MSPTQANGCSQHAIARRFSHQGEQPDVSTAAQSIVLQRWICETAGSAAAAAGFLHVLQTGEFSETFHLHLRYFYHVIQEQHMSLFAAPAYTRHGCQGCFRSRADLKTLFVLSLQRCCIRLSLLGILGANTRPRTSTIGSNNFNHVLVVFSGPYKT